MPEIIIRTDDSGKTEVHRERVSANDVESETATHLLVERIAWALSDADTIESGEAKTQEYPKAG